MNGRILEANDAFLNIVGYTQDELLSGRINFREKTPPEYMEQSVRATVKLKVFVNFLKRNISLKMLLVLVCCYAWHY